MVLNDVMEMEGRSQDFNLKNVVTKFQESCPDTKRKDRSIRHQAKKLLEADPSPQARRVVAQQAAAAVASGRLLKAAPPITAQLMAAEVMSTRPDMQAMVPEVWEELGSHPIYARQLSWWPSADLKYRFAWQPTVIKALTRSAAFSKTGEVSAKGNRTYRLDPTAMSTNLDFWKAAPYVLASLLATWLRKNQATVEELAAALITHPLYSEMLAAADGVSKESLAADRFVPAVTRVVEAHPELFATVAKGKSYKGPPVYSAIVKPFVKPTPARV